MKIETSANKVYKIVTIEEPLKVIADLTELKTEIERMLKEGEKRIGVNFSDASYLYSGAISILITCYRMVKEKDGDLCIIEPHPRIHELLTRMNIDSLIDIYKSEQEMIEKTGGS